MIMKNRKSLIKSLSLHTSNQRGQSLIVALLVMFLLIDPFGPTVRKSFSFRQKLEFAVKEGFSGIQFHDDDAVDITLPIAEQDKELKQLKQMLDDMGLEAEFVAPRLWEHPMTVDGGWTSNSPEARKYALDRSLRTVDIANALGTKKI